MGSGWLYLKHFRRTSWNERCPSLEQTLRRAPCAGSWTGECSFSLAKSWKYSSHLILHWHLYSDTSLGARHDTQCEELDLTWSLLWGHNLSHRSLSLYLPNKHCTQFLQHPGNGTDSSLKRQPHSMLVLRGTCFVTGSPILLVSLGTSQEKPGPSQFSMETHRPPNPKM